MKKIYVLEMYFKRTCYALELQALEHAIEKEIFITIERGDFDGLENDIKALSLSVSYLFDKKLDPREQKERLGNMRFFRNFIEIYAPTTPSELVYHRIIFAVNFALSKHYRQKARLDCLRLPTREIRELHEMLALDLSDED